MDDALSLWRDTLAPAHPFQEDKGNTAAVQGGEREKVAERTSGICFIQGCPRTRNGYAGNGSSIIVFSPLQPLAEGLVRDPEKPGCLGNVALGPTQSFVGKQLPCLFNRW